MCLHNCSFLWLLSDFFFQDLSLAASLFPLERLRIWNMTLRMSLLFREAVVDFLKWSFFGSYKTFGLLPPIFVSIQTTKTAFSLDAELVCSSSAEQIKRKFKLFHEKPRKTTNANLLSYWFKKWSVVQMR